jgi:xanthine/uracil permease
VNGNQSPRWRDGAVGLALTVLMIAAMLYIAVHLILAVLPVLIGLFVVAVLGYVGWWVYHIRGSRW